MTVLFSFLPTCLIAESAKEDDLQVRIKVEKDWLLLPMKGSANYQNTNILDEDGKLVFSADTLLADFKPDWRAAVNVSKYKGQELVLPYKNLKGKPSIFQSDNPAWRKSYTDRARPLFHLTAKEGTMGEPCGMIFAEGKWHAFFLWNPYAMNRKPPYFVAHAVSDDLTLWSYEPPIFIPEFNGTSFLYPMGGSVYRDNSTDSYVFAWRFSDGTVKLGRSKNLKTIDSFVDVAILSGGTSVPNIFFDDAKKLWYLLSAKNAKVQVVVSPDLKDWILSSEIDVDFLSPSMAKVVDSDSPNYILFNGDGRYLIGDFSDGTFKAVEKKNELGKESRIFFGNVFGANFWRNAPNNRLLASTMLAQPEDLLRDVGQSFSNTMSLPYQMRIASTSQGYRLRASVLSEITEYFDDASDALGVTSMNFRSNIFSLPDAVGNYFALIFTFDTTNLDSFSLAVGVSTFEFNKKFNGFYFKRVEELLSFQYLNDRFRNGFIDIMMFVDSYDYEALFLNGQAVVFFGDSFLNPEQEIKIGAKGLIYLDKVSRIPILSTTQSQRGKIAREYLERLKKEAEEQKKQSSQNEGEDN